MAIPRPRCEPSQRISRNAVQTGTQMTPKAPATRISEHEVLGQESTKPSYETFNERDTEESASSQDIITSNAVPSRVHSRMTVSEYHENQPRFYFKRSASGARREIRKRISDQPFNFSNDPLEYRDTISRNGSNAIVHAKECEDAHGNKDFVAVKVMNLSTTEGRIKAENEVELMKRNSLRHNHIIAYLGRYKLKGDPDRLYVMSYPVAKYNLKQLLEAPLEGPAKDEREIYLRRYFSCISEALNFLHSNKVKHRDIKPENILIDKSNTVLLTDFDLSKQYSNTEIISQGPASRTIMYSPREVADAKLRKGMASDVFSLGCVFLEMTSVILGHHPSNLHSALVRSKRSNIIYHQAVNDGKVSHWVKNLANPKQNGTKLTGQVKVRQPHEPSAELGINETHLNTILNMMDDDPKRRPKMSEVRRIFKSLGHKCESCSAAKSLSKPKEHLDEDVGHIESGGISKIGVCIPSMKRNSGKLKAVWFMII
ncbi:kinase-like protein [Aaosphaeria arxii CBS 175.79]|uniref:Kinase-like protein n=1 Tax=Aaosphaeria arxii CBS 175.79 TaxID=1450172 RepID=A0A6A5XM00_9PLEO|nr:kinase-like protein [Aaosphaeria arxii CBS 175.79]KAF2014172.1 kinase-like protein [Aaosphaeria arxii CBS 175.79]